MPDEDPYPPAGIHLPTMEFALRMCEDTYIFMEKMGFDKAAYGAKECCNIIKWSLGRTK